MKSLVKEVTLSWKSLQSHSQIYVWTVLLLLQVSELVVCMWLGTDDGGDIEFGGVDSSDYDQQDDTDNGASSDTQERRMAPAPILTRPGLLAGKLTASC